MRETNEPCCFHCRQLVVEPPFLNRLADGSTCPVCRERVLDALPSLLPSSPSDVEVEAGGDDWKAEGPRSLMLIEDRAGAGPQALDDPPQPA